MSGLKRNNTLQTIKRAGTGAWKWINADDVNVSENKPMGYSYFQRSNTYKKLHENAAGTAGAPQYQLRQRPTYNEQSYGNTYQQDNSYSVNMENSNNYNNSSYNNSYVTDIKRPEPAAEKEKKKEKDSKGGKINRVPTVLYDPKVRKQLEELKQYKPYFMYFITGLQIFVLLLEFIINYNIEGQIMAPISKNFMLGPNSTALIRMGARYVPCMKKLNTTESLIYCPKGIEGNYTGNSGICTFSDICGLGGFKEEPNQWTRFILPIFLHAGVVHIIVNLTFQVRTGIQMEKDFGTWRMMIIYMASGIFGFAFGANFSIYTPSVGCSGALYGLLACLLLDLLQNWRLIIKPWIELVKMSSIILVSLGVGLLPFIDNFAHVGGFIIGILTGLIFMPTIIFSKWDLRRKRVLMVVSIILLIVAFVWVFKQFYDVTSECKWCKYVNCIPGYCGEETEQTEQQSSTQQQGN